MGKSLKLFGLFVLLVSLRLSAAKAQYPTDSASIYLMTATPGEELYSAWGHSAIRVSSPSIGYDIIYNYGTFDFSTPNFYTKFTFGRLLYFLSKTSFEDFTYEYRMTGQGLYQQKLNLTNKEKWQLVNKLETNHLPENRYYRYDFFRDNCATRIRDIVEKSVDGKIVYDATFIKKPESFRQLLEESLVSSPWTAFGMDLMMGKGADSIAGLRDYMFLPAHYKSLYLNAKIVSNGGSHFLAEAPVQLLPVVLELPKPNKVTSPAFICWFAFLIVLGCSIWGYKKNRHAQWFDIILFSITGIIGLLLLALALETWHSVMLKNMNIVWLNPLNVIVATSLLLKKQPNWHRKLMFALGILIAMFIPVSFIFQQQIPAAAYALMGVLVVRVVKMVVKSA
ncbi:MAG: DUF4105 domain-containing protein [Bacteroidota bacterium]|nr:DUF4105 domain-containing protein [Bacteroidota bacterium]